MSDPRLDLDAAALEALARKYRVMSDLRSRHVGNEARAELKALATEFPGALRELDRLPTEEIASRCARLDAARSAGVVEDWMRWMHAYHVLMRAALGMRRRRATDEVDPFANAVRNPRSGRIMVEVFDRLALAFARPANEIWDALFPSSPGRSYRGTT